MGFLGISNDEVYVDIDTWQDVALNAKLCLSLEYAPQSRICQCLKSQIQQHKSPLTPRYIQLANGLRALLISELKDREWPEWGGVEAEADGYDEEEEEEAAAEQQEDDDEGDSGEGTEEEEEEAEEEADSDFEELDEEKESGRGKKASSEKQVCLSVCLSLSVSCVCV